MLKSLCKHFMIRASTHGLKGKKRDDEACAYFAGAAVALTLAEHPEANQVGTWFSLVLSVRGYEAIEKQAAE